MKPVAQTSLAEETIAKAAYPLCAEDQAFKFDNDEALCQVRPDQDTCVVVRLATSGLSVVRCHFTTGRHHISVVERVLRAEYGICF